MVDHKHLPYKEIECFHCGTACDEIVPFDGKSFCCQGCKMVYEILHKNQMGSYYSIEQTPGSRQENNTNATSLDYLDDPEVVEHLIEFQNEDVTRVTFLFPQIHCASCIWLLENLHQIGEGIVTSRVNFIKKEATITFEHPVISLKELVRLLASIGYPPAINLSQLEDEAPRQVNRRLFYQLGVAGFAFGNIMLLSFPEYLGLDEMGFQRVFGYLIIVLSLPVLFYSGIDYLKSAWYGLRNGHVNMDVPISLGMLALFGRSLFEILSHTGAGYLDSLAGLVFFLLIGKWFQQRTYHTLNFERDYKSYFPIGVTKRISNEWVSVPLSKVEIGDLLWIRNGELIPTDGMLTKGSGQVDYSFVTGESKTVPKAVGDKLFAGGKQTGAAFEMTVTKGVKQSYLTQLWNDQAFSEVEESKETRLANEVGKYFTFVILTIAIATFIYWYQIDVNLAFQTFTAVLIIACPCAIALAIPFTYGNMMRWLARYQFYMKNIQVIEGVQDTKHIVFDKTGTLTQSNCEDISYAGVALTEAQKSYIKSLTHQSNHPLSRQITASLEQSTVVPVGDFLEVEGKGIRGRFGGDEIRLGSSEWTGNDLQANLEDGANVQLSINNQQLGVFYIKNPYREGFGEVLSQLGQNYEISLLSGDHDGERTYLSSFFQNEKALHFRQKPKDKLAFISKLQKAGQKVIMVGDGLNDAGALKQSDVGIVITENINNFTPASDVIMAGSGFKSFPNLLKYLNTGKRVIIITYLVALVYNIVGLSFAVQAKLSPVIAAILMPLSSITVVIIGVGLSTLFAQLLLVQNSANRPYNDQSDNREKQGNQ